MPPPAASKKLSCKRCQFRKLKCSRTEPCSSCDSAKQTCEYSKTDSKRRPVSHDYVQRLESRVAWLESLLSKVKHANAQDRDSILEEADFADHLSAQPEASSQYPSNDVTPVSISHQSMYLPTETDGTLTYEYHGPTSILHTETSLEKGDQRVARENLDSLAFYTEGAGEGSHFAHVAQYFNIDVRDEFVTSALLQFFKWQYPQYMFIYREAFLRDHFGQRAERKYWSFPLLFAICGLGLLMLPNEDDPGASERFYAASESILLVSGLSKPCITTVQAFLCLAYYEIGRGNLSKGWAFSGIAFRMAQNLGFQRSPQHWEITGGSPASDEDIEIRRRIYWGCYISDKLISLLLGKPVTLHDDDALVEVSRPLPDFPEMAAWGPEGFYAEDSTKSSAMTLVPSFQTQIELAKIIQKILIQLFSAKRNPHDPNRKAIIEALGLELCRWEASLDETLRWNRWQPSHTKLIPSTAALWALYRSLNIVLHLEFLRISPTSSAAASVRSSLLSSSQDIIVLLRQYRSQYGLHYAPIVVVYSIVQALKVATSFGIPDEAVFLSLCLDECSSTWTLATKAKQQALGTSAE